MPYKQLTDGSYLPYELNDDPNEVARKVKEKNLTIKAEEAQFNYLNSDKNNPATELIQEDVSFGGKVGRGALNGLVSIPTEIASTIGYGLQLAGEEEAGERMVSRAKAVQEMYAPNIEGLGFAAELPKALVQFGVPGGAILKATKGIRKGAGLLPLAAAEFTVASPDMETFGDSFLPGGPTKTKDLQYLDGQEKAYAALENKGKVALEGAALALGVPFAFAKTAQIGLPLISKTAALPIVGDVIRGGFTAARETGAFIGKGVDQILKESPKLDRAAGSLRYRGMLPDKEIAEIRDARSLEFASLIQANKIALDDAQDTLEYVFGKGDANGITSKNIMDAWDKAVFPSGELLDPNAKNYGKVRDSLESDQIKAFETLVEADKAYNLTGKNLNINSNVDAIKTDFSLFRSAKRARETIDNYSEAIQKHPDLLPKGAMDTIGGQLGLYGTRQYRAFLDKDYKPSIQLEEKAIASVKEANKKNGKNVTDDEARGQLQQLIEKPGFLNSSLNPKNLIEDSVLLKMNDGVLKGRTLNSKAIREYLGEYSGRDYISPEKTSRSLDVRKADVAVKLKETLGRQAGIISKGNFIDYLDEYNKNLPKGKEVFRDVLPEGSAGSGEYTKLADSPFYGKLRGKFVKNEYINALEKDSWQLGSVLGPGYTFFLGLKGLSQLGKTAYNPVGQVRNVTSAMGFALANGNVPNGQTMAESFSLVSASIKNEFGKDATGKAMFEKYSRLGVVGQQAQLGELNSLIDEAAAASGFTGKVFGSKALQGYQNSIMTKLYQGGDDVWRIFNFKTESQKIQSMIAASDIKGKPFIMKANTPAQRKIAVQAGLDPNRLDVTQLSKKKFNDFVDEEAAFITRDVVPNYERVPEAIRLLRQTPLGNFIAYPAEIIRTSLNILGRSITELSSENALMRARGMERLLGFSATTVGIPSGITALGHMMTGSDEEQLDAYRRSGANPWDKNASLVTVGTEEIAGKTVVKEAINLSYTMPYEYLITPFIAVQNAWDNGVREEKDFQTIAYNAMLGDGGVYDEFFKPFMGQAMISQRAMEVYNGRTDTGYEIGPGDTAPWKDKAFFGFSHIFNGLIPTISPAEINADVPPWQLGEITPGGEPASAKNFYGISRALNIKDLPTAALQASGLVDPRYKVSKKNQLDLYGEMFEAMSGIKTVKVDMKKSLRYKAIDLANKINSDAGKNLRKLGRTNEYRSTEEFEYNYEKKIQQQMKLAEELRVAMQDAKTLGLSQQEINKILSDNKVPRWQSLVRGNFVPSLPNPNLYLDQKDFGTERNEIRNIIDQQRMRDIYGQYKGRPLPALPPEVPQVPRTPPPDLRAFPSSREGTRNSLTPQSNSAGISALRQAEMNKLLGL
tara:strand:+ start:4985 stop:9076 length:4092 start_codon:yes stop_codon:yes gene_type:complete